MLGVDGTHALICVIIFQMTSINVYFMDYDIALTLTLNSFAAGAVGAVTMIRFAVEYVQSNIYGSPFDSLMNPTMIFLTELRL